jgi:aspartate kinase
VDGVLTADPRLVPGATTISELSYREAAELAYFGARVLHPKTLRPVMQSDIPVWIRNTFAPERCGTKITPSGLPHGGGVRALSAISDVALITVGGPGIARMRDIQTRTFTTASAVGADIMLISQTSLQNEICFVVPCAVCKCTVEALREEFAQDLANGKVEQVKCDTTIAIVAAVGEKMRGQPGIVGRALGALVRENINIMAVAQGASDCNITVVVGQKDIGRALATAHREFQLDVVNPGALSRGSTYAAAGVPEMSQSPLQTPEGERTPGMD